MLAYLPQTVVHQLHTDALHPHANYYALKMLHKLAQAYLWNLQRLPQQCPELSGKIQTQLR